MIWIPESKLESWKAADHDAPLTDAERETVRRIVSRIYGHPAPSAPEVCASQPVIPRKTKNKKKRSILLFSFLIVMLSIVVCLCIFVFSLNTKNKELQQEACQLKSENEQLQREASFFNDFAVILPADGLHTFHRYGCEDLELSSGFNIYNIGYAFERGFSPCFNCITDFYVGNSNSHIYHRPTCWTLPSVSNRVFFLRKDDAEDAGYISCCNCQP